MKFIKLHKNNLAAYVNIDKIAVIQSMRNHLTQKLCSCMYIDGDWRVWDEEIDYIYSQLKTHQSLIIKLHRADGPSYFSNNDGSYSFVLGSHISIINAKLQSKDKFNSRTCINGYWFLWQESVAEIMSQLNINLLEKNKGNR